MELTPNDILNKIVNAEIETTRKLKKVDEELKNELKEKRVMLEKKKIEDIKHIEEECYSIIQNAEDTAKKILEDSKKNILFLKEKYQNFDKKIDDIASSVLEKIIS